MSVPVSYTHLDVYKRQVFTSDNVARLRFFTYSFAALYGLMTLHDWLNHLEAVKQVALLGYEAVSYTHLGAAFAELTAEEALDRVMDLKIMSRARPQTNSVWCNCCSRKVR